MGGGRSIRGGVGAEVLSIGWAATVSPELGLAARAEQATASRARARAGPWPVLGQWALLVPWHAALLSVRQCESPSHVSVRDS